MEINSLSLENNETIVLRIENQIKNNHFNSKEQLSKYLVDLKNNELYQTELSSEKIEELLNLYDSLNKQDEMPLDMKQYADVSLENQDLIVSKETDRVLKTLDNPSNLDHEFKQTQNEITANSMDGLTNANTTFEHIADHKKEEISLISIEEAIKRNNIDMEILNKIKFFITSININLSVFRVDIESGIFYNIETDEVYEVRKNNITNQYEIYKGLELVYGENTTQTSKDDNQNLENDSSQLEHETDSEQMTYETRQYQPKVRKLTKPISSSYNNAAFTKIGLLIINIITFSLLILMIILLNK